MPMIESQWWVYGYSPDIFSFSLGLKNVHNKNVREKMILNTFAGERRKIIASF